MIFDLLPDDCFAYILSLTSPADACRISLVSSTIRVLANADNVWEKFLPSDYQDILSRLLHPLVYSSKKELFFRWWIKYEFFIVKNSYLFHHLWMRTMALENCPMPVAGSNQRWLANEKSSGKKCYMLSARELNITWAENPLFWTWKPFPSSRFSEVAELRTIWWLEIQGRTKSSMLSPTTVYEAYLIVKFADRAYGLDLLPSKVSVEIGNVKLEGTVYLRPNQSKKQCLETVSRCSSQIEVLRSMAYRGKEERVPCKREDGWIEIELGSFYNHDEGDVQVNMCLKEVKGTHLKGGLIVQGIELRPK
ncbi:hypothetical protein PTKIN_Ptkin01aG0312200 [Pterospermum kingtungense]